MELKPCKCGATPRCIAFRCRSNYMVIHQVECFNHPTKPIPRARGLSEAKAIEKWNDRFGKEDA